MTSLAAALPMAALICRQGSAALRQLLVSRPEVETYRFPEGMNRLQPALSIARAIRPAAVLRVMAGLFLMAFLLVEGWMVAGVWNVCMASGSFDTPITAARADL